MFIFPTIYFTTFVSCHYIFPYQDESQVVDTWRLYYKNPLNINPESDSVTTKLSNIQLPPDMTHPNEVFLADMDTDTEWSGNCTAISKAKLGKASGYDNLPIAVLRLT